MDGLQYVRACLEASPKTTREIARGSGLPESWLRMFRRGKIVDPGYSKVQLLVDYFTRTGCAPVIHEQQSAYAPHREQAR